MRGRDVMLVVVVWFALAAAAGAQTTEPAGSTVKPIGGLTFRGEVGVTLMEVTVQVTDENAEPVTGLQATDFRLYQDGEPREITNFAVVTGGRSGTDEAASTETTHEGAAEQPPPQPEPVHVVLFVDNHNLHPRDRNRVLDGARKFVETNLGSSVQMMVVSADPRLRIEQGFTSDREAVLAALDRQRKKTGGRASRDQTHRDLMRRMAEHRQRGGSALDGPDRMERLILQEARAERNALRYSLDAQQGGLSALAGFSGRKALVYVSNGLPTVPAVDLLQAYASTYDEPSIMLNVGRLEVTDEIDELTDAANAHRVSYYTLDAGDTGDMSVGSAAFGRPADLSAEFTGRLDEDGTLVELAVETGGRALAGGAGFGEAFDRIAADLLTFYSLGFPLERVERGYVAEIEVEVPEHPEYTVRHRSRLVQQSHETRVENTVVTNLLFPVGGNPLGVSVDIGEPERVSEDRWLVPIHLSFPLERMALLPEDEETYSGRALLFLAVRSADGEQSELVRQEHTVRVPAERYERARRQRFGIDTQLLVGTGELTISLGLMDRITRRTSYLTGKVNLSG